MTKDEVIFIIVIVALAVLFLVGVTATFDSGERIETNTPYIVTDKMSEIDSSYNFLLQGYKTTTNYYLVLEDYGTYEVDINEYSKYEIGDEFIIVEVSYE